MICTYCREAGIYATAGNMSAARLAHADCRGGTWCDCQHKTVSALVRRAADE